MISQPRYTNFLSMGKVDEQAAAGTAYQEYVLKYPGSANMTCRDVYNIIAALESDIRTMTEQRAAGTTDRVGARYISAAQARKADFEKIYTQMKCVEQLADQERESFLDDQYNQLSRVQDLAKEGGKTSTYLIYGMLGLVVLVGGVILIKKLREK